ncbi:hypothetical protein B0H13DRAFT_523958 [Mycena leptocephala]|nr:hypothetical protein B0H13DRAFT_523958 [Mycena leptocephala]
MVSGSITAEEAQSLSLPDLRRREYLSLRSLLHHSSLTSAAFAGALADPTGLLLIAALAAAAKEGIDGYEEWKYLAVLQGEVRRRGLEPCKATAMDQLETFFATFVGQEVQQVLGRGLINLVMPRVNMPTTTWSKRLLGSLSALQEALHPMVVSGGT